MNHRHLAELDLAIPDMDTETGEELAQKALEGLPGVKAIRFISRGAWLSYDPSAISHEQICAALRQNGFRASTFQDSETGHVGQASA